MCSYYVVNKMINLLYINQYMLFCVGKKKIHEF